MDARKLAVPRMTVAGADKRFKELVYDDDRRRRMRVLSMRRAIARASKGI